jgi:hypothetical protein
MARPFFHTALLLLGLAVSGCSTSSIAMMGADAVTQLASGRSISGNVIHALTGKDCVPLNLLAGKPACQDEETKQAKDEKPIYCYRTLGQVDCHSDPDPMMSPTTRLYRLEAEAKATDGR